MMKLLGAIKANVNVYYNKRNKHFKGNYSFEFKLYSFDKALQLDPKNTEFWN